MSRGGSPVRTLDTLASPGPMLWRKLGAAVHRVLADEAVERLPIVTIVDLNGVLLERLGQEPKNRDARSAALAFRQSSHTLNRRRIWMRPHHAEFIRYLSRRYTIGVWSSATFATVQGLLDIVLEGTGVRQESLIFVRDRVECPHDTANGGFATIKPLRAVWTDKRYEKQCNPTNTIILDDSPNKARENPSSAILVPEYTSLNMAIDYNSDETLLWTAMYLESMHSKEGCVDVRSQLRAMGDLASFIAAGQLAAITETGRPSVGAFISAERSVQPDAAAMASLGLGEST
jgi:NLI interacting factor-like phosphatase